MSHLLLEIKANKYLNRTMFPHRLYVYDDKVVYKQRKLIKITETTISYNHMSQVDISRGLFFASLEIINTGGVKDILIRHVGKRKAMAAKRIIDQKIHNIHATSKHPESNKFREASEIETLEKNLNRLKELHSKGRITSREHEKRKKKLLKTIK